MMHLCDGIHAKPARIGAVTSGIIHFEVLRVANFGFLRCLNAMTDPSNTPSTMFLSKILLLTKYKDRNTASKHDRNS